MADIAVRKLQREDFIIDVHALDEDISPARSMHGCEKVDIADFVESIKEMRKKSKKWGWCTVCVTAKLKDDVNIRGNNYLGCCSYDNKNDFIQNSGYYEQMVEEAIGDAQGEYDAKRAEFQELLDNGVFEIV